MTARAIVMSALICTIATVNAGSSGLPSTPPTTDLYLARDGAAIAADRVVHDYGESKIVHLRSPGQLSPTNARYLHRLSDAQTFSFRSWTSTCGEPRIDTIGLHTKGFFLLPLAGPIDQRWLDHLNELGITVVATGHPWAVVVKADGRLLESALHLTTSEGFRVVRDVISLPVEARLSPELLQLADEIAPDVEIDLRVESFTGNALDRTLGIPPLQTKEGRPLAPIPVRMSRTELAEFSRSNPEVAYIAPAASIELHNNLAVLETVMNAQRVWSDPGYNGSGVTVSHNDSGVDLIHPDLDGAVIATMGSMSYTNNGHGTHTAGSVAGRGITPSPVNTSGCGDQFSPLPNVGGVAWGASLAVNNIFDNGITDIPMMMGWGVRQGATISTNSWGIGWILGPFVNYELQSAEVDALVRDADPSTAVHEPLAIFYSAGNGGPGPASAAAPGNAKNAVTMGASHNARCGSYVPANDPGPDIDRVARFSSRGPAQGRIKPDLVAPGADVLSAESGDREARLPWDEPWTGPDHAISPGTSMSCPLAAGAGAVFSEFYQSTFDAKPSPAMIKAALINGAVDMGYGFPSYDQGWGRINLGRSVSGPPNGFISFIDQPDTDELTTGEFWSEEIQVFSAVEPLKITLVWTDVPGEAGAGHPLVNDLDLVVTSPGGTVYRGNAFFENWSSGDPAAHADRDNNVENVFIESPQTGAWVVEVVAANVAENPPALAGQDFVVVYSGDAAECAAPPAPGSVHVAAVGDNVAEVSWQPSPGATQYAVFRSMRAGGRPYHLVGTTDAGTTVFRDTDVSGGVSYFYVVRVFTDCWSAFSDEISVTTTGLCYLAPVFAGLDRVADHDGVSCTLDLSWEPGISICGNDLGYDLHRSTDPTFVPGPENLIAIGVPGNHFADTGLTNGRKYHYIARARDLGNASSDNNTVLRSGRPSGPDAVFLSDDIESGGDRWTTEPGSDLDFDNDPWTIVDTEAHSVGHSWHVADHDGVKDQTLRLSSPFEVATEAPVVLEYWHRFDLEERWDGGRLEYSTDGGHSWFDILEDDGRGVPSNPHRFVENGYNNTLITGSSLNPLAGSPGWTGDSRGWNMVRVDLSDLAGRMILLRWRLGCDGQTSVAGGWWLDDIRMLTEAECQVCLAPPPPSGLVASVFDDVIELEWEPAPAGTSFTVHRAQTPGGPYRAIATLGAGALRWVDLDVSGGSTYYYVLSMDAGCRSDFSDEVSATAVGSCTLEPTFWGVTGAASPHLPVCTIDLDWSPAVGHCDDSAVSYLVYRSADPVRQPEPGVLIAWGITDHGYRDQTVSPGQTYSYTIHARDDSNGRVTETTRKLSSSSSGPDRIAFSDAMEAGDLLWRSTIGSPADHGSAPWSRTTTDSHSSSMSWFCPDRDLITDRALQIAAPLTFQAGTEPVLEFWHRYDLERGWDGGRLEYSTDDGATWHDILEGDGRQVPRNPDRFIDGSYTTVLSAGSMTNPLAGEQAWTGDSVRWIRTRVDLTDLAPSTIRLRWRLGCDASRGAQGWWIDDVRVSIPTACRSTVAPRDGSGGRRRP